MKKIGSVVRAHVPMSLGAVAVAACGSFSLGSAGGSGSSGSADTSGSSGTSVSSGSSGTGTAGTGTTGTGTTGTGTTGTAGTGTTGAAGTGTTGAAGTGTTGAAGTGTTGTAGTGTTGAAGTGTTGAAGTGTTGTAGTGTTGASGSTTVASGPCDILGAAGNPCVAAHSTVRALYGSYTGNLYQVKRASDSTTMNIGVVSGYANAAPQDTFCAGTTCTITTIYDQSTQKNDLTPAPAGGAKPTADGPASATALKLTISGHEAYGILITTGIGYRKLVATGTATGDNPETEYMVTSQNNLIDGCCFDYGNAETDAHDDGNGTMEAIYFGGGVIWGTGSPGGHTNGPWVMGDLENGLFAGWQNNQDQDISTNTPLKFNYVTAMVIGDTRTQNAGNWAAVLRFMVAQCNSPAPLTVEYDGIRPSKGGYVPMSKQGSIILGTGGDNSDSDGGEWFEGVMTTGAATLASCNAVQANIVAAGYGK